MRNSDTRLLVLLAVLALQLAPLSSTVSPQRPDLTLDEKQIKSPSEDILVVEGYYHTNLAYEPEEYIGICNTGGEEVNLTGWNLTDLEGTITFPADVNTTLYPGEYFYLTKNATAFSEETGEKADFEYDVDSDPSVPQMDTTGSLALDNGGDEIILNNRSRVIDAVVYADSNYTGRGWSGEAVEGVSEGYLLKRNRNETTDNYVDTNTSSDWMDIRRYGVGQSDFSYQSFDFSGNTTVFSSPDSSYHTLTRELENATSSIFLNVYDFTNPYLSRALVNASDRGVDVRVLLEGGPVGGIDDSERWIAKQLYENGTDVRFMVHNESKEIYERYNFDHAKYCVVDNQTVILTSENWGYTGIPVNSTFGNRGWGIAVRNNSVSKYFAEVFFEDFDPTRKDSYPYTPGDPEYGEPSSGYEMNKTIPTDDYPEGLFPAETIEGNFTVSPVLCPDTSTLENKGIIDMIDSAQSSVYIQQLSCRKNWSWFGDYHSNLYLEAAIDAARRGCEVRVLLDSAYNWTEDSTNWKTVQYLRNISREEDLDIKAKLVDLERLKVDKVHNKGVIVDGNKTLISSINWGYNSVIHNRETGVIVENEEVADFYTDIFLYDWGDVVSVNITSGWNHISLPSQDTSVSIEDVLSGVSWDKAMVYSDECWASYVPSRSSHYNSDFPEINNTMGIWVHATEAGVLHRFTEEIDRTNITLQSGWNMVGYPSGVKKSANRTLPSEVTKIGVFNASRKYNIEYFYDLSDWMMKPGNGYWVYNSADYDVAWRIEN